MSNNTNKNSCQGAKGEHMDDDLQRDLDRIRELLRQLCPEDKERILERCQANEEKEAAAIK